ncbi:MAG TPA: hypothetical protein VK954_07525 [Methyloradius sp.]|nr:hypothetical protein [Methyloradius sp.]
MPVCFNEFEVVTDNGWGWGWGWIYHAGILTADLKKQKKACITNSCVQPNACFPILLSLNQHILQDPVANIQPQTRLGVARNITSEVELIVTEMVAEWKKNRYLIGIKNNGVFVV